MGSIKGTPNERFTFKKGSAQKRGGGGKRPGTGPKSKAIKALEKSWKTDYESVDRVMSELKELALNSEDEMVRLSACRAYLDRVVGRPKQQVDVSVKATELNELYGNIPAAIEQGHLADLLGGAAPKNRQ